MPSDKFTRIMDDINQKPLNSELINLFGKEDVFGMDVLTKDEIDKLINMYDNMIDLGKRYSGMGYYIVLSWVPKNKKFMFRMDGGGCGQEEEAYYKQYRHMDPTDPKEKITFYDTFNDILNKLENDQKGDEAAYAAYIAENN